MELYDDLAAAGCRMDNHESDLYVEDTPEARALIAQSGLTSTPFFSAIDGRRWLDVPFAYAPWWRKRAGRTS